MPAGRHRGQAGRVLLLAVGGRPGVVEVGQGARLAGHDLGDLLPALAQAGGPGHAARQVQVAPAVSIPELAALTPDEHRVLLAGPSVEDRRRPGPGHARAHDRLLMAPARRVDCAGPVECMLRVMLLERDAQLGTLDGVVDGLACHRRQGGPHPGRGRASARARWSTRSPQPRRPSAHVHTGACDDLLIPRALNPFWDMARHEPSLRERLDAGDRSRVLEAVLDLMSRPRPSILIIEDTQWADAATLDAIRFLGRRIARTNAVLVLTYRDSDVDLEHPLRGVVGDIPAQSVVRIQLDGLSLAAVTAMVAAARLDPDKVLRATRGNPFLVQEMVATPEAGLASVRDSVMAQVSRLTIGSQEMLKILSVIPEPVEISNLLGIALVDTARLLECEQRGLLERDGGRIAFRHELIRQAVHSALTAGERLDCYREVLRRTCPEDTHPCLLVQCAYEIRTWTGSSSSRPVRPCTTPPPAATPRLSSTFGCSARTSIASRRPN